MEPVTRRRWEIRNPEADGSVLLDLALALGVGPLAARAISLRGVSTAEEGRAFLDCRLAELPDPFLLPDMEVAVSRLVRAIENAEPIAVHGDYDVDGITGTALLVEALRAFGARVDYHIPLRMKDGYGLSGDALQRAASNGARVALSVDCGVSAVAEARLAAELGLDLIITDHHQAPEELPQALAIINPHLPASRFPFKELSGVGVAFFLLAALRRALREKGAFGDRPEPDLRRSLDLVALGTIADIVPLQGINRTLTKVGLQVLSHGQRPGVQALKTVAGVDQVSCGSVGFRLAPRLNAAGRLEDAALGVALLLESNADRAREVAELLDGFNRDRQQIEVETLQQALQRLEAFDGDARSIVLADERWHSGVIGIVASRLVERFHRPTVLIALDNGEGKGSARSISGFHLFRALQACSEQLLGFGGHAFAAGMTVAAEHVEGLCEAFEGEARKELTNEDLIPRMGHDGEVLLQDLSREVVDELARLNPFGAGNPEPVFVASAVRVQQVSVLKEQHLRFTARQDGYSLPCIAFGMAERLTELQGDVDLLFAPALNEWKGRVSVQLRIKDFRPSLNGES